MADAVPAWHGKWREEVPNVLRKRQSGRKRASAFGWECSMRDIDPTAANGCLQRSGYRDVDVFVRNVTRRRDKYGIDSYGATVKYEIRTDTGRKVWSHEERIGWAQRKRKTPSLVQLESENGRGTIASMVVSALDDEACAEMEEAALMGSHEGSRKMPRNKRCRASSMTNLKTLKVGRCYVGVELSNGIARIEIDGPEHSANMELDHTSYVYDRSEKYLSDQKREIFDAIRSSVKSCNNGRQLDNSEFMEISDCADFIWDYFTSFHEDEIRMMQEDFMNSPYGSWFDYDKGKTSHLRSSTEMTAMGNRRNASRRKSAWNDGFGFNGDSAWMVWYDDFAIDCDADRMPDGTWRVVYTLMDPLDTDGATGLSRLGKFDVDLSGYEYEEDALRDFMEDNVQPVPQADRDRYSLRDTVGYIMNEYGRIGTIETRKDVADAYMSAYGNLPSDDELDEIVDCINDNYFVHISSRRPAKASSCRRPKGSVACNRSARNSMARRAGAHNCKKSMRKGAGFHNIPREFGGGWIETDEVEPGRWRARGSQGGEYATRAVYGRTEQEAVRKAVKEMQGYPEARDLAVDDVMGAEACRSASRRGASARRSPAKRRASSSLPPDDRKSSEVYAVDKAVNYILSNKDRLNGKRDNVIYDNVFDFVYNDLLSDKSLVNDLGFVFGSENPYNLAGYITQEAIDYSADTYGLTIESKRNLHRTANRKKMPVKSSRARRIAAYGRKNKGGRR